MNTIFSGLLLLLCMSLAAMAQTPLSVTQGRAAQRAGTKLVDVYYDVSGGVPPYTVTLEGSSDGGAMWTLPVNSVSGNVGSVSSAGANRKITWNAGADWGGQVSTDVRFRVSVSDSAAPDGFALIPVGSFQMGDTFAEGTADELPVHTVYLSAFYMGKFEVTKGLWEEVRAWAILNGYTDLPSGYNEWDQPVSRNNPVDFMDWYSIVKWCNARSEKDGLNPCYRNAGVIYKSGRSNAITCDWSMNGYRLPTEAEWEKAARGGRDGNRFPWGNLIDHSRASYWARLDPEMQVYDVNGTEGPHPLNDPGFPDTVPAGSLPANDYGLHEIVGNAPEWCWDWAGPYSASTIITNPRGPETGDGRIVRGGGWPSDAYWCRTSSRYAMNPDFGYGFRLARNQVP